MLYPLKQLLSDGLNLLSANLFALENEDGLDGKEGDGAACAVLPSLNCHELRRIMLMSPKQILPHLCRIVL